MKETKWKHLCNVCFQLYKLLENAREFIVAKIRLVIGWGCWLSCVMSKNYRGHTKSFWLMIMLIVWISVDFFYLCIKTYELTHFKCVHFIACQLCCYETVNKVFTFPYLNIMTHVRLTFKLTMIISVLTEII
jgi:hypothetical protein